MNPSVAGTSGLRFVVHGAGASEYMLEALFQSVRPATTGEYAAPNTLTSISFQNNPFQGFSESYFSSL